MNFKHFNTWSIVILLIGLIFLTHSIITLIYSEPVKIVFRNNSLWPFQKSMADFSITFVLGIGFSAYEEGEYKNRMIELGAEKCLSKYKITINELLLEIKNYCSIT